MGTSGSDYGTASISNLLARLALVCSMSEGLPLSSSDKVGKLLDLYFRKKKTYYLAAEIDTLLISLEKESSSFKLICSL